jgi:hypothetical protein
MTQQTLTRSFLKHSQPLLTKCLQAALITAPVLLAAAPSQAGSSVYTTVNGFTGAFAPSSQSFQWNRSPASLSNGNIATFNNAATQLSLTKNPANTTIVTANYDVTSALFEALEPFAGVGRILSWKATGSYNWSTTGAAANDKYDFRVDSNNSPGADLNPSAPSSGTFSVGNSYLINPFDGDVPDVIDFTVVRTGSATGSGTGVISNFQFVAEYDVPGPLPVVGAAAAFAWSRRLRKRLNSAKSLA